MSRLSSAHRLRRLPRRLRILLATKPLAYWLLTAAVATLLGYVVAAVVATAQQARYRFGTLVPVVVATRPITTGETLDSHNTTVDELPLAVVADGVLHSLTGGSIAAAPIARGEPVHQLRVGRGGDGPVAALLPVGTRGIAVPVDEGGLPLQPGDHVDVVAGVPGGTGGAARVVSPAAAVVHVSDRAVVVAIAVTDLPAVAQAMADGGVLLALSAGR